MTTQITLLSGSASGKLLLPGNVNRYYLAFSMGTGSGSALVKPSLAVANSEGFLVPNSSLPLVFRYQWDGEIVQEPWYVGAYSLTQPLMIVEGIWIPGSID